MFQKVLECSRRFQNILESSRGSKRFQRFQKIPEVPKDSRGSKRF